MHRDLGVIDGPVMLFGGPYSNFQAITALLKVAAKRGIAGDQMICTGDVVAYCADPEATVAAIREVGAHVVAGNCEKQLAAGAADCGCGFDEGSACDLLSRGWYAHALTSVSAASRDWMTQCPDLITFRHQGARYGVLHGGVTDIARFLWPTSPETAFAEEWQAFEAIAGPVDVLIAGHCGLPFIRDTARGTWINAGVIGMPPHDGGQQTRYAILDGGEVLIHRLSYDVQAAFDAMQTAGLTQGYHHALLRGYWPSDDILPEALRDGPSLASG